MAQTGSSNTIVSVMLGWLKGLASWVLRLFNLSGGISPLRFLADNWLRLVVVLLVIGFAVDILIWLIRWRPHWVWFRRKRVIINDRNFFAGEDNFDEEDGWARPKRKVHAEQENRRRRDWQDDDFVVASETRRQREERKRRAAMRRREQEAMAESAQAAGPASGESKDVFRDGLFNVNAKQRFSDRYEDEVFSVSNLPRPEEDGADAQRRPKPTKARAGAPRGARGITPGRSQARPSAAQRERRPRATVNKR